jgi:hypothetical protein
MEMTLSFEQARDGLRKAVEARGADFVYPDEWRAGGSGFGYCVNFDAETLEPRCIIGYVLWLNGVVPDSEDDLGDPVDKLTRLGPEWPEDDYGPAPLKVDTKTFLMLYRAQNMQDDGKTWGDAVMAAEKTAEAYERNLTGND